MLRQIHEFVDSFAALWPNLQGGAAQDAVPYQPVTSGAEPVVTVSPRAAVKPGERTTISMTLRNTESQAVHLVPMATDLLGSRGGRIPNSVLEFRPPDLTLEPQEQKDLTISARIPVGTAPGCYSGLLVVGGLDYLRALITIDVAGSATAAEGPQTLGPRPSAATTGTLGSMSSAAVPSVQNPKSNVSWRGDGVGYVPRQEWKAPPATQHSSFMQEAIKLTEDGELGNSDAICLLQIPHRPEEIKEVLGRFEHQLTREAKSKLTLEAFAPLPDGVNNQRYEPIFDRYPITGRTYTTASGTVVLNEVQFYNGEIVQLHGECPNVEQVREDLAGSGYKPLTMRQADGRESAIAQFWANELTDTSLRPYNSAFIIVAAVPDDTPTDRACFAADENGLSSVLSMFDGTYDPAKATYKNQARSFYVRLLDSTRIAIEVGRERLGADKRPGTVQVTRKGKRRSFSAKNGAGDSVAKIDFVIADNPDTCLAEVATAAATAGIPFRALPAGTECIYPSVARIGAGPVVNWQWRTDILPRLQHVEPNTMTFDSRSEEGGMLIRWGFKPKLLGYIPNVRGAATGVP
jgi:hypothetical protein